MTDPRAYAREHAESTVREITQQPDVWRETASVVQAAREGIDAFLAPLMERPDLRIVFTGAGTSAFVGGVAAPALARLQGRRFEAVATTDIVSNPREYLAERVPTLLVSFARSGNSPESVAATRLADELIGELHHLVITCDPGGALSREHAERRDSLILVMPPKANDQGFAMTSSFTSMLLCALLVFEPDASSVGSLATAAQKVILREWDRIQRLTEEDYRRVVYLGSGPLSALAQEAALKLLELTAGEVVSYHDSSLGFRHGPKAVLDERTLAVVFVSGDEYTRRYDLDIVEELRAHMSPGRVLALSAADSIGVEALTCEDLAGLNDAQAALVYIVAAQILALSFALHVGTTPDNPFPGGSVNRVVQGVKVHPLAAAQERQTRAASPA